MTTTTVSEWAFHNYGPLTTTYTAPGSCFTGSPTNVQLGSSFLDHETNSTSVAIIAGTCASTTATTTTDWKPFGDCLPSGSDMDKNYAAVDTNNPLAGVTIDYFSPGLYCPSGYTTAGIASKGDGGTITSSGPAFVPSTALLTQSGGRGLAPYYNIAPQVLLQEIHEGETAILCARSSYTVNLGGYAWSELPDYPIATIGCYRLVPDGDVEFTSKPVSVFGTTVTAEVYTYVSTNPITETQTQTFSKTAGMVAVSIAPLVTLIHQAADITSNDGNTSSTASAASAGRAGGLNGAGLVACLWAASLAVGILYTSIL